jgi:hypothetical protein
MRKPFVLALLGLAGLGLATDRAAAWCWCCHHCCVKIHCKQYNAFSPFCCDGACGYVPLQQFPTCPPAGSCYFPGGNGCLGELPASAQIIGDYPAHASTAPAAPTAAGPVTVPPVSTPPMMTGPVGQPWQAWGPGMMNPAPAPAYPGSWQYVPTSSGGR